MPQYVEEIVDSKLMAARHVFGSEPHDTNVLWFINHKMMELLASSKPLVCAARPKSKSANPKKLARQVAREMQSKGISTSSQEAIKENLKSRKVERRIESKLQREELAEKKREMATLKAKAKHRGK
ncbi:DUF2992 family protein [Desulfosporosinus sp. PR]|uniref:DUF2992 family protein n=1 Tax=Candidatus Desulfosporosinus nitrosoreducens TaxID=3401928 RepID=UPI0027F4F314|nr:DUF2992 family protein [Desulfosporosinus sp. PR]MDQ7092903.1 DUF2992 family protein [Desulfosporosinus sp. PR]